MTTQQQQQQQQIKYTFINNVMPFDIKEKKKIHQIDQSIIDCYSLFFIIIIVYEQFYPFHCRSKRRKKISWHAIIGGSNGLEISSSSSSSSSSIHLQTHHHEPNTEINRNEYCVYVCVESVCMFIFFHTKRDPNRDLFVTSISSISFSTHTHTQRENLTKWKKWKS